LLKEQNILEFSKPKHYKEHSYTHFTWAIHITRVWDAEPFIRVQLKGSRNLQNLVG